MTAPPTRSHPSTDWRDRHAQARTHLERHGHLRRAAPATRRWVDQQIRYCRAGRLGPAELEQLAAIGIDADSLTSAETTLLAELDWWTARHGHARVPQMATSRVVAGRPYWLGKRVSEARIAHRRGTLNAALTRELADRPGWTWHAQQSRHEALWKAKYQRLERHVARHGSLAGLDRVDRPTYRWLQRQRVRHPALSPDRAQRLARIPGALTGRDARVEVFVQAARAWLTADARGERDMSQLRYADTVELDGATIPLGRRATYYRRRYHGLEGTHGLTDEETAQIGSLPGWSWQLRERYRHPRS